MVDGGVRIKLEDFQPVHDNCESCDRIIDDPTLGYMRCKSYINPTYWWSYGRSCPLVDKGAVSIHDVVKKAIATGLIIKEKAFYIYNHQGLSSTIDGVINALKLNRGMCTEIRRKLGLSVDETEQGKIRVGQQKHKKKKR